ncbi:Uu.00g094760.m01.CDS01 [Anthostomella pinea]|uniref:Uu.00g094760.m01.CDS01 n=1 Tax=Anthostomella pinea TaxID=933095 RepID=A0AAI8VPW4_9PEZI|nr:Uu.00g094760.m01.CDS01 [Anthostomella pinea]
MLTKWRKLMGIGESVTVLIPQSTAFGKDIAIVSEEELSAAQKTLDMSGTFYSSYVSVSKLSVYVSLLALSPSLMHRYMTHAVGGIVVGWMITSFLGVAFQCGAHGRWDTKGARCINMHGCLAYMAVTNILTDAALIAIPTVIVYPLHTAFGVRVTVIAFYMTRILVIVATICQLVYLSRLFGDNFTLDSFPYYLSAQFVQFTSITASCVVYFWPLLKSLQSGFMLANDPKSSHQQSLATFSKPTLPSTRPSRNGDRRPYIEITLDVEVHQEGNTASSIPAAERYNFAWEQQ